MILSISNYAKNDDMKKELDKCFNVRNETLKRCYEMPGYEKLSRSEKNAIYDAIKKEVETEVL